MKIRPAFFESGLKSSGAERVSGFLTNREKFVAELEGDSGDEFWKRVRDGVYLMSIARNSTEVDALIEEKAICIVLGNSIDVIDCEGVVIGAAIYSPNVSWINHSCVPNSCYHFILGPSEFDEEPSLKIAPSTATIFPEKRVGYGPRCVVRSILAIEEGEEVTASCINLLEPEEIQRRTVGAEDSALALFKASAAYSVCGAMAIHNLFVCEPVILPIAAESWVKAGEALILYWGRAEPAGFMRKLETLVNFECNKCLNIKSSSHNIDPQILANCMEGIFEGCASYIFSDKMFLLNGKTTSSSDVAMPSVMAMALHCLRSSIHRTYIKLLEKIELHDV